MCLQIFKLTLNQYYKVLRQPLLHADLELTFCEREKRQGRKSTRKLKGRPTKLLHFFLSVDEQRKAEIRVLRVQLILNGPVCKAHGVPKRQVVIWSVGRSGAISVLHVHGHVGAPLHGDSQINIFAKHVSVLVVDNSKIYYWILIFQAYFYRRQTSKVNGRFSTVRFIT